MSGLHRRGLSYAPRLDEGGLIFQGGLKEVNFKLRVVYKVTGYVEERYAPPVLLEEMGEGS